MPTFYWVGKGCPKEGTSSSSHLWGTSEYDWNTPNNWIVAHSLHHHRLDPLSFGVKGPIISVLTEVYAVPNRCPGPGDKVYVGHYPWLRHFQSQTTETVGHYYPASSNISAHKTDNSFVGLNDLFFNADAWKHISGSDNFNSAPAFSRINTIGGARGITIQQVLYRPINSSNGRVTAVQVPKALYGTSTVPLFKKFYATTTNSLNGGSGTSGTMSQSAVSEWWDGPSTWINGEIPGNVKTETDTIASILDYSMVMRNQYRTNKIQYFYTPPELVTLPAKAQSPLLWGGCVAGSTGITSSLGISGGSGNTLWFNASDNASNLLADPNQALDELNIIMYGDRLPLSGKYLNFDVPPQGGQTGSRPRSSYDITFWDPYPFKSFGDGLFGEEHDTVVERLKQLNCSSPTGGFSTNVPDSYCYNCVGATSSARSTNLIRIMSRSLTAEGERATCVFVKAHNVNVRSPFEYNKYAGNNPVGKQQLREDDATMNMRLNSGIVSGSTTIGDSWMYSNLGVIPENNGCDSLGFNCTHSPTGLGTWVGSCKTCKDKYVELHLAEFFTPGTTASVEEYKTVLHADMRFGQVNLAYGRVQEANLGVPFASYGNEYAEGSKTLPGVTEYDDFAIGSWNTIENLKNILLSYNSYTPVQSSLALDTTFINSNNNSAKFGLCNPFWPSASTYFVGSNNSEDPLSRVNRLNSYSVSATVNPMADVGVSRIFLSIGDTVEMMGGTLTSSGENAYNYTQDMGSVYVNHGYPIVIGNNSGVGSFGTMGKFLFGSTMTGNRFFSPYISIKPVGVSIYNQLSAVGPTGSGPSNTRTVKTAYTSPIFYSQVGDLALDNTDFTLISPDSINYGIEKYGNKTIDRAFIRNDVIVDFTKDDAAYLHFGRILKAGSTGGTGSVYGGIIFESDTNQIITPPAGARFWVSKIDGNILDTRQTSVPTNYVSTYYPEGQLESLGNFPSSLGNDGEVTSTGRNPYASYRNQIFEYVKDNVISFEAGNIESEVQAL